MLDDIEWRLIRPTHPASTASVDVIATMKSQLQQSATYWTLVETPNTGTQSLLLASSTSTGARQMYIVIAGNITSSAAMFNEATTALTNSIQFGLCVGSASFLGHQLQSPFGPQIDQNGPYWTRYATAGGILSALSQTYFLESAESLAIGLRPTGTTVYGMSIAGAIIDRIETGRPEVTDDRCYGISSTGRDGSLSNVGGASTSFPAGSPSAGGRNCLIFIQSGSLMTNELAFIELSHLRTTNSFVTDTTSSIPTTMFHPLFGNTSSTSTTRTFVGKFRGLYLTRYTRGMAFFTQNGVTFALSVTNQTVSLGQGITFAPFSGSITLPRINQ
jgi:hypothetical protein